MNDADSLFGGPERQLVAEIEKHNRLYWELGEPAISDADYDKLLRDLEAIHPGHPLLTKVNAPAVYGEGKVVHAKPMLSLDKAYSLAETLQWANKHARGPDELFLVQPKYDGISANFDGSVLSSRGDGAEGENISAKLPLITLETTGHRGKVDRPVRGEIVIRDDDFKNLFRDIKKRDGKPYKNSRNAVAGIMGLKDISEMRGQGARLTLVDYDLVSYEVALRDFAARWQGILDEIEALPYPMDGVVVKLADAQYAESLGNTAHHPRGQLAFKFSGLRVQTTLLAVEWSFGKSCLTPIAKFDPVEIGGVTVKQATLHNAQNIVDKGIQIGDTITVERAGDVIPYVLASEPGAERHPCLIDACPSCGSALGRVGPELCCPNPDCPETRLARLLAAVRSIGIERLGEPNVRKMVKDLGVKTLADIFDLKLLDLMRLDGFQAKSAANLFNEIQAARNTTDFQVLSALNIYAVGKTVAKRILEKHSLEELRGLSAAELATIDGVGPERAESLSSELRAQAAELDQLLTRLKVVSTKGSNPVAALKPSVCFTGKMPEKRSFYEDMAAARGYQAVDAVTKDLALLVADDVEGSSSKLQKARKLGVKIMALPEWLSSEL